MGQSQSAPSRSAIYLLLARDLTICEASDEYRKATLLWNESVVGRAMFDVFPDNPSDSTADGVRYLRRSFRQVLRTGRRHRMAVQHYDMQDHVSGDGEWVEKHWLFTNSPVFRRGSKKITHIMHEVVDITEPIRLWLWSQEQLTVVSEQLRTLSQMHGDVTSRQGDLASQSSRLTAQIEGHEDREAGPSVGEMMQRLGAPDRVGYLSADERAPVSGIYSAFHREQCNLATARIFVPERRPLPRCPNCRDYVLYRLHKRTDQHESGSRIVGHITPA